MKFTLDGPGKSHGDSGPLYFEDPNSNTVHLLRFPKSTQEMDFVSALEDLERGQGSGEGDLNYIVWEMGNNKHTTIIASLMTLAFPLALIAFLALSGGL